MTIAFTNPTPFLFGFLATVVYIVYAVTTGVWTGRVNVHEPWEYDSELRKAIVYARETDWNWRNIVLTPIIVGAFTSLTWWAIYIVAGWWA